MGLKCFKIKYFMRVVLATAIAETAKLVSTYHFPSTLPLRSHQPSSDHAFCLLSVLKKREITNTLKQEMAIILLKRNSP